MLIRMQFRKTREGRFMSHLDLMHTWERVIRRSQLPLGFSQGFNPHPKMNFASACAVGTTSDGEYMDIELTRDMPLEEVKEALDRAMPPAFEVTQMKVVEGKVPSLMSIMERASYRLRLEFVDDVTQQQLDAAMEEFFKREEITVFRYKKNSKDKKPVNIRPGVFEIRMEAEGKYAVLHILVQTGNDFNVRPEEVAYGLMSAGMPAVLNVVRIHRNGLYLLDKKGNLITPLDVV
ncbi:MAG: TIGR03936 family radical SAM-associated protein [Peptococcaceae bacterium]|nr:TIGR03936 family radical SAM-associated protein [Peptococcaceae bacterium]